MLSARLSGVGLAGGDDVVGVIRIRAAVGVLHGDGAEFLARELLLDDESLAVGRGGGQVRVIERLLGRGIVHGDGGEVFYLHVVREGEDDEERRGRDGAEDDEGRPAPAAALALVRDGAEERQQEERQHVVRRHDDAGERLRHAEFVREYLGYNGVVGLPEGADKEKGETDEDGALIV